MLYCANWNSKMSRLEEEARRAGMKPTEYLKDFFVKELNNGMLLSEDFFRSMDIGSSRSFDGPATLAGLGNDSVWYGTAYEIVVSKVARVSKYNWVLEGRIGDDESGYKFINYRCKEPASRSLALITDRQIS